MIRIERPRTPRKRGVVSDRAQGAERLRLGPIENPVRGFLHGSLALTALGLSVWLWTSEPPLPHTGAFLVLASSHALLYGTSALYHTVPWRPLAKDRMQRLDHSMIYVAVAGTVTGIVSVGLEGLALRIVLALTWTGALTGAAAKLSRRLHGEDTDRLMVGLQVGLGALALTGIPRFVERFPGPPTLLLVFGVLCFALGGLCWVTRSPRLWPRVFSFHEVFHVCTVLGSGAYYALFLRYLSQVG